MDYELSKFITEITSFEQHRKDMIGLVQSTTTLVGVIARNRVVKSVQ
jgi:hypothetical protein